MRILIELCTVHLSVGRLGGKKFCEGIGTDAVDSRYEPHSRFLLYGFLFLHAVIHDRLHGSDCLLVFGNITDCCHYLSLPMR